MAHADAPDLDAGRAGSRRVWLPARPARLRPARLPARLPALLRRRPPARWWWQRALVTGASGGIGAEAAARLIDRGVAVVLVARRREPLEALAERARARGVAVEVLPADLAEAEGLARVEARLADAAAPVDLLVNNAGFGTYGPLVDADPDVEAAEVAVNVTAVLRLTRAALPGMVARGRGTVLNVSSVAGSMPQPYAATYAATKAWVSSFTHALVEELRGTGVTATALAPGYTPTEFHADAGLTRASVPAPLWTDAATVAAAGLEAAAAGRAWVVPGWHFRVAAALAGLLPPAVTRRVVAAGMRQRLADPHW